MRRVLKTTIVGLCMATAGFAQSSGSFSAAVAKTACTLNTSTGALGGGLPGSTVLSTTVQTPNSSSTALDIRFSGVTGLYTDTKITDLVSTSSASAGVTVFVTMDGQPVAPNKTCFAGPGCYLVDGVLQTGVVYDQRFQQVTQNFFNLVSGVVDCTSTDSGTCDLGILTSTLSAHSLDFVAPSVGGGNHNLKVSWALTNTTDGKANSAACVGPAVLTVTQVKNFNQNSPICISSTGSCQ